jgi:hypothetical protein
MCFDDVFFNGMMKLAVVYFLSATVFVFFWQLAKYLFPTGDKK